MSTIQPASASPHKRRMLSNSVRIAIIVVAVTGFVGALALIGATVHANETALTDCRAAVKASDRAWDAWDKARGAAITRAKDVDKADVSDPGKLLDPVAKPAALGARPTYECTGVTDVGDFAHAAGRLHGVKTDADKDAARFAGLADDIEAKTAALVRDVDAVTLKALDASIESAGKLVKDSDGKVADNATRDALSKELDAARTVAKATGDEASAKAHKAERVKLDAAAKAVNDSMAKKTADDQARAAAEAQAAQAAQAQASQSQSGTADGRSYGYRSNGYGSTGATPKAQPQQRSSGGGLSAAEIQRMHDEAMAELQRYAQACATDPNSTTCAATRGQ